MRKKFISMSMAAFLCISTLSGCQKMPEASDDQDIPHAQGVIEQQVADIAGENTGATPQQQSGGFYEGTIGTTDNKMHINAQIPAIPANVYQITLVPNEGLDKGALRAFLDSPADNIEDTSQELLDEIEKSEYNNLHGENGETCSYSVFGDHSALQLTDGKRDASFARHTSANYIDYSMRDTYLANVQNSTTIPVDQPDTGAGFSVKEAQQILGDKLGVLGITEIAFREIELYEGNGYSFYSFDFVPSYEGIAIIRESVGRDLGELYPWGNAWVTPEGVAVLDLVDFYGKVSVKEPVTVLSFEQVERILEQYLDSNMIQGDEQLMLDNIELEYYPVPNSSPVMGEIEYKPELELIPIWHIYMSLEDYIEHGAGHDGALFNICINAVTGEIERVLYH